MHRISLFRISVLVAGVAALPLAAASRATWFPTPYSPRLANYDLSVTFDPPAHVVSGRVTIHWKNGTTQPTSELRFHLYQNAFATPATDFMHESGGQLRGDSHSTGDGGKDWGYEEVSSLSVTWQGAGESAQNLTAQMKSAAGTVTTDGEKLDDTVLIVPLPKPAAPGDILEININFKTKLPHAFARSGFHGGYTVISQWFPKLGVLEEAGWNCHAYHANSEFYSDFGVYDVEIHAPRAQVIAAVGESTDPVHDGVWHFHAEDVHDFAFAADPSFKVLTGTYARPGGAGSVNLIVYYHEYQTRDALRHMEAAKKTLAWLEAHVGPYPYPVLSIVDPAKGAEGTGGMEYPTFITTDASPLPYLDGLRFSEVVTEHEIGHQWFYGMLASNEFEEPWLDEGLNQAQEARMIDETYGGMLNVYGMRLTDLDTDRMGYRSMPDLDPSLRTSWGFASNGSYGNNVYAKTAVFMAQLRHLLGDPAYDAGLKNYYQKWSFKHPHSDDFIAAMSEGAGRDLKPYFDTWLRTVQTADYYIKTLTSERQERKTGWYAEKGGWRFYDDGVPEDDTPKDKKKKKPAKDKTAPEEKRDWETEFIIARKGGAVVPVEFVVTFEDDSVEKGVWDGGGGNWKRQVWTRQCTKKDSKHCKFREARLDPENKLTADLDLLNNRKAKAGELLPSAKAATRGGSLLMFVLDLLGGAL